MINHVDSSSSLANFFGQLYVINLPKRQDRRQDMEWELKRAGVSLPSSKVSIFPAIEPADKGDFPSIGARGCFLSHLAVLTEAREQVLSNVLIVEDDLSFTKQFLKCQNTVTDELQRLDWDIAYLGHVEAVSSSAFCFQEHKQGLLTTFFIAFNSRVIPPLVDFLEEVLQRPAGHPLGGPMHVDGAYSTFRYQNPEIITLIAKPSLGFQRASSSDVTKEQRFGKLPLFTQLSGEVRKVKNWYRREFM